MREHQVAKALIARGRAHEAEDDEERHGGDDLGHHQRLVDERVDQRAPSEPTLAHGAQRGEGGDRRGHQRGHGGDEQRADGGLLHGLVGQAARYQSREKPPHWEIELESLKE
jgi:hypothetical protein